MKQFTYRGLFLYDKRLKMQKGGFEKKIEVYSETVGFRNIMSILPAAAVCGASYGDVRGSRQDRERID